MTRAPALAGRDRADARVSDATTPSGLRQPTAAEFAEWRLNEFEFRWNTRKLDDGRRVAKAIRQVQGKRLQYRESVDRPPYFVPKHQYRVQPSAPFEG